MTTALTPTSEALPGALNIPSDGERVDSLSVRGYMQTTVNAVKYCTDLVRVWLQTGGVIRPPRGVSTQTSAGETLFFNGLELRSQEDGGGGELHGVLVVDNYIIRKALTFPGGVAAGEYAYAPIGQTIYFDVSGPSMGAGVVWKIDGGTPGDWIRLVNYSLQFITVKDGSGATVGSLGGARPAKAADTYVIQDDGSVKQGVDPVYAPVGV